MPANHCADRRQKPAYHRPRQSGNQFADTMLCAVEGRTCAGLTTGRQRASVRRADHLWISFIVAQLRAEKYLTRGAYFGDA